jgi:hypothetical protein
MAKHIDHSHTTTQGQRECLATTRGASPAPHNSALPSSTRSAKCQRDLFFLLEVLSVSVLLACSPQLLTPQRMMR